MFRLARFVLVCDFNYHCFDYYFNVLHKHLPNLHFLSLLSAFFFVIVSDSVFLFWAKIFHFHPMNTPSKLNLWSSFCLFPRIKKSGFILFSAAASSIGNNEVSWLTSGIDSSAINMPWSRLLHNPPNKVHFARATTSQRGTWGQSWQQKHCWGN